MNQTPAETALSRAMIKWSLARASLVADTPICWIYRVEQHGNSAAGLKIFKTPTGAEQKRSGALLDWYAGEGAVTVFDRSAEAVFMEWADGPVLAELLSNGRADEVPDIYAGVVSQLLKGRETRPPELLPLIERFKPLFVSEMRRWPFTARDLYARATGIAIGLFDRPAPPVPLHGNLSYETILRATRGWLAIDPIGLHGDPAFEPSGAFGMIGEGGTIGSPRELRDLAELLGARLGLNHKRILGFAAAQAALAACDALEHGRGITAQLAALPNLLAAYDAA